MQAPHTQDLVRRAKIDMLQHQIEVVRDQIQDCDSQSPQGRELLESLITLVQRRNNLHTPADVAQIEKERGLV